MNTLPCRGKFVEKRWPKILWTVCLCLLFAGCADEPRAAAQQQESPVSVSAKKESAAARFIKLLKSGRAPPAQVSMIVERACAEGDADDLAYIFAQAVDPKAWNAATRQKAFDLLSDATELRKVKPTGDLSPLKALLLPTEAPKGDDAALQLKAVRLAGLWKDPKMAVDLQKLATSSKAGSPLQNAVIDSLGAIGGPEGKATLLKLAAKGQPQKQRYRAVAALAKFEINSASKAAAEALADAKSSDELGGMMDPFLSRKEGLTKLSAALKDAKFDQDVAKRALSYMYSIGHSDPELSDVLSKAAGLPLNPPELSAEEREAQVLKLVPQVTEKGNPERGEVVFRRADISCLRCHSIAKAGGEVGPELSAVGKTSPLDYIVRSILNPSAQIKEEFDTRVFVANGVQYMGIVKGRNPETIELRDATGKNTTIAVADLDEPERIGKSMMPEGLTKFLTQQEVLDLAAFVNQLGKPGPYDIRVEPTIQRWRVFRAMPANYSTETPNVDQFRDDILGSKPEDWSAVYSKVSGSLPVKDAVAALGPEAGGGAIFLQGELDVTKAGKTELKIEAPARTTVWIDADPYDGEAIKKIATDLKADKHKITLRVPIHSSSDSPSENVKVELSKPSGSAAQFQPVGGP